MMCSKCRANKWVITDVVTCGKCGTVATEIPETVKAMIAKTKEYGLDKAL